MDSKKSKFKIQKSVEESILDAVTKFKKEDKAFNIHDPSQVFSEEENNIANNEAEALWGQLKNTSKKMVRLESQPPPPPHQTRVSEKKFVQEQAPDFTKKLTEVVIPVTDGSQLQTVALGAEKPSADLIEKNKSPEPFPLNSIQLKLYENEHLKIAQNKIDDLGKELDRLRIDNEKLAAACDLFQKKNEESLKIKQDLEKRMAHTEERFSEERLALKNHIEQKDLKLNELHEKISDFENRLSNDIRKSRSRERELENRLELAQLERISLVGSKDEIILDLKRQVDQLNHELGNYRKKVVDMNQIIDANQDQFRRTVRALRLALTNLEINEQIGSRSKKAE